MALLGTRAGSRRAEAAPPAGPVRFLAVRTPHGVDRDFWIPRNGDGSEPKTPDEALSGLTFDYDDAILSPLNERERAATARLLRALLAPFDG